MQHTTKINIVKPADKQSAYFNTKYEKQVKRKEYVTSKIDGLDCEIRLVIDYVDDLPIAVFIDGNYPLYETYVVMGTQIIGYDKGRINRVLTGDQP